MKNTSQMLNVQRLFGHINSSSAADCDMHDTLLQSKTDCIHARAILYSMCWRNELYVPKKQLLHCNRDRMLLSHQLMPDDVATILTSNVLTLINRVFHRACSHIACDVPLCAGMTATVSFVPKESPFENREMSARSMIMRVIVYVVLQIINRCSWSSITNPAAISYRCHEISSWWLTPYGIAESCMNEQGTATEQPVFSLWECADINHCYCTRCAYIYIYMCMKHKQCIEVSAPLVCARTRVAGAVCHN